MSDHEAGRLSAAHQLFLNEAMPVAPQWVRRAVPIVEAHF